MQPGQQPYYNQDPWGAQQYAQAPQQAPQAQGFFVPQQPAVYGAAAAAPPAQQHGGYAPGPAAPAAYGGGYPTSPSAYAGGGQPGTFVPPQPQAPQPGGGFGGMESDFLSGVAGNVLRQQGQSYLQRGQAFVQSKMGFLSGSALHYHFSITPEYVRTKLLLLAAPFLKRWNYARHAEQISGGHKYLPPRQDVNAPDLYIPVMALWTYCLLLGVAALARSGPTGGFKPETIYNSVSSGSTAWLLHTLLLKVILYLLGIPGAVPILELAAYAGYAFVAACASLAVQLVTGSGAAYHAVWAYGSLCCAIFLVRTMKRVIFQEARTYSIDSTRHNYLLLGLAIFQFPLNAWLARVPPLPAAAAATVKAAVNQATEPLML